MKNLPLATIVFLQFLFPTQIQARDYHVNVYGVPISCTASNGQLVPFYSDFAAAEAARQLGGARADLIPNFGFTIAFDPLFIKNLPRLGAFFTLYHECAHVALPMGVGLMSPYQERNADCYAVRAMRAHGLISNWNDFEQAMSAVILSGGGHYIDQSRINAMADCLR